MRRIIPLIAVCAAMPLGAQGSTDIYLAPLSMQNGRPVIGAPVNLTNRPGYDNQPSFTPDSRAILYTSTREDKQSDIYKIDIATKAITRVTTTPESEYSATVMPGGKRFSVIRVERDSTQRLWAVPLDNSPSTVVLERIKPVGYHTWANDTLLALFVLGSPNTLQLASTTTGRGDTITTSIGRSLHTTRDGQVSFVHKVSNEEWWLTLLDPKTKQQKRLVRMPRRVEDYSWTPDGLVLIGEGSVLKSFDPQRGGDWETVADLAPHGVTGITRLSVSPRGDAVAVVAVPSASGRSGDRPR